METGLFCKYCGEEISSNETVYKVDGGYVHEGCIEDYVDDVWQFDLNLVNKMQLLDIDTGITTIGSEMAYEAEDRAYDDMIDDLIIERLNN